MSLNVDQATDMQNIHRESKIWGGTVFINGSESEDERDRYGMYSFVMHPDV